MSFDFSGRKAREGTSNISLSRVTLNFIKIICVVSNALKAF